MIQPRIVIIHPEGNLTSNPNLLGIVEILTEQGYKLDIYSRKRPSISQPSTVGTAQMVVTDLEDPQEVAVLFPAGSRPDMTTQSAVREQFADCGLVIGVDRGIIEAALLADICGVPYGFISYEILFSEETGAEYLARDARAAQGAAFVVCQDRVRSSHLAHEYGIPLERIIDIPVAGRGAKRGERSYALHDRLGIDRRKKIALAIGAVNSGWTGIDDLLAGVEQWPDDWVLVLHHRYAQHDAALKQRFGAKVPSNVLLSPFPSLEPDQLGSLLHAADLGIGFYLPQDLGADFSARNNIRFIGMASGKLATYLQHGLPVLVNEIGEMSEYVRQAGIGYVVGSCEQVPDALHRLENMDMLEASSNALNFFSRRLDLDVTIVPLLQQIKGIVYDSSRAPAVELSRDSQGKQEGDDMHVRNRSAAPPLVSAIVSTYASAQYIRGCIEDLQQQTIAERIEIIVIDSASPQNEGEIVRELQQRYCNIRYLRTDQRETVYAAWNRGIAMAKGRYLTNANTDDRHRPDAFELMVKTLDALPDIDLVYADVLITRLPNETFETTTTTDSYNWPAWDRAKLLDEGCFIGPQPMWRKAVHELYGGFDASYVTSGDYEFWLRISQTSQFQHIGQPLGLYLARPDSIEHANEEAKQHENAKIRRIYREAVARGELVGLMEPQPIQAAVREANRLAQRGDTDAAVRVLLNQGIRVAPEDPAPYRVLAELLIAAGRYEDALEVLPEMPLHTDPELKLELEAVCRCAVGADESAGQAAARIPHRPRAVVVQGTLAARRGDLSDAEQLFRQAVLLDDTCSGGWLGLGMLLWGQGRCRDAWQAVQRALVADPCSENALQIACDMADRLECQPELYELLYRLVQSWPESRQLARHHARLAVSCAAAGQALDACESFLAYFDADGELLEMGLDLRRILGPYDRLGLGDATTISLCMIVKDEEQHLARCLASVKAAVHELVVVDTGSSDRTVEIADLFGARVVPSVWQDDYAAARNVGLAAARGAWVLVLDADEVIAASDHAGIAAAAAVHELVAWQVTTRNYVQQPTCQGWQPSDGSYAAEEISDGWYPSSKVRLFRRDPQIAFQGIVHEMVEPALRASGYAIRTAAFVVHHYGELDTVALMDKKQRYYRLGQAKLASAPADPVLLAELAVQVAELGQLEESLALWERLLALQGQNPEALFNRGGVLLLLKRYHESAESSRRATQLLPSLKEAWLNLANASIALGDLAGAKTALVRLAALAPEYPPLWGAGLILSILQADEAVAAGYAQRLSDRGYNVSGIVSGKMQELELAGQCKLHKCVLSWLQKWQLLS